MPKIELIDIKTATGKPVAPGSFDSLSVFVPEKNAVVCVQEGSGDNLTSQDREDGLVDYVNYASYELGDGDVQEADAGEIDFPQYVQEKYEALAQAVPDVLEDLYSDGHLDFIVLA